MPDQIYIAWTNFQRRAETLREVFGYRLFYVEGRHHQPLFKLIFDYPRQFFETCRILRGQATTVWVQSPPSFLLHIVFAYRLLSCRRLKIIVDVHNAGLNRRWLSFPFTLFLLNKADVVIVHNNAVKADALAKGVLPEKLCVLEDRVPRFVLGSSKPEKLYFRHTIVMPGSFREDEPIHQVIEAARIAPEFDFIITGENGRAIKGLLDDQPANVVFPGFLEENEFNELLLNASAILCLTSQDGIQLSAAIEALGAGKPMIVSDTPLLRQLFGGAGLFVKNTPQEIADVCREAIRQYDHYASATERLRHDPSRQARWSEQANTVLGMMGWSNIA
jgi:glycosyltransferase involved in cell wall biosynthesis